MGFSFEKNHFLSRLKNQSFNAQMGSKMSQKEQVDTNHLGSKYKTVDPSPVEKSLERLEILFASRMYF